MIFLLFLNNQFLDFFFWEYWLDKNFKIKLFNWELLIKKCLLFIILIFKKKNIPNLPSLFYKALKIIINNNWGNLDLKR
jgi:hypothetical protein